MLGAGVAAAVALRRRRRAAERAPGLELPPLPQPTAPVVTHLASDDVDTATAVADTIRHLAQALADRPSIPAPLVASVHDDSLELLLDRQAADPPAGWSPEAQGWTWRGPLTNAVDATGGTWAPALVSIGASDAGGFLLNLEAVGTVGLVGDDTATTGLAASIAMELAIGILTEGTQVHVVEGEHLAPTTIPGINFHPSLDSAINAATGHADTTRRALLTAGAEHVIELRCRAGDEPWPPSIVIARYPASADAIAYLVAASSSRSGLSVVVVGACPVGATEINITGSQLAVPALGMIGSSESVAEPVVDLEPARQTPECARRQPGGQQVRAPGRSYGPVA